MGNHVPTYTLDTDIKIAWTHVTHIILATSTTCDVFFVSGLSVRMNLSTVNAALLIHGQM